MLTTTSDDFSGYVISVADTHSTAESSDFDRIEYDAATGDYILHFKGLFGSFGTTSFKYANNTLGQASHYPFFGNNPNFNSYTTYNINLNTNTNVPSELYLYKIGADNTEINLTYVSFGVQITNPFADIGVPYIVDGVETFFVYGVPTTASQMPITGTATYNGVVWGSAKTPALGAFVAGVYDVSGTSSLVANFANATLTTSMTFSGTLIPNTHGIVMGVPPTTVSGAGTIGSPGFQNGISVGGDAGTFHGNFAGGGSGTGTFSGRFYGPNAQEFGLNFSVNAGSVTAAGIAIGKK